MDDGAIILSFLNPTEGYLWRGAVDTILRALDKLCGLKLPGFMEGF